jgi:hypothetical protein
LEIEFVSPMSVYDFYNKNSGCAPSKLGESSEPFTDRGIVQVSSYNHNNNSNNNNNSNIGTNQSDYDDPPLTSESAIIPAKRKSNKIIFKMPIHT